MKYLTFGIFFCFVALCASAQTLEEHLDSCLIPRGDEAIFVLSAEINACGRIWNSEIQKVCIDIAREIINVIVNFGVDCVRGLPIAGLTDDMIFQVVYGIQNDVNNYIAAAENKCLYNPTSVSDAVNCFIEEVRGYAQTVTNTTKNQLLGFPIILNN